MSDNQTKTVARGVRYPAALLAEARRLAKERGVKPGRILVEATAAGLPLLAKQAQAQAGEGERHDQKE